MSFLIARNILAVIPVIFHKIDSLTASVVFTTIFAPMLGMAGGHAQINRWAVQRHPPDYHRLAIDYLWLRVITDVDPAIKSRLANAD